MSDSDRVAAPPRTGNSVVDEALGGLVDLDGAPVADQYERLREAQAVLAGVLATATETPAAAAPRDPGESAG